MVLSFINSITVALYNTFGESYRYYVEELEQNAKKPCFLVGILNPLIRSTNSKKYDRTIPIVIHYFTNEENTIGAKKDCYKVAESLVESLEYISVSDCLFRGEDISWELVEGVLQFFVTYRFEVTKIEDVIYMEDGEFNDIPL